MSQNAQERMEALLSSLEHLGLRSLGEKLVRIIQDESDVPLETIGSTLIGTGVGLLTSVGFSHDNVRATVEVVLGVLPDAKTAPDSPKPASN